VKSIQPAHQGSLEEVRDRVIAISSAKSPRKCKEQSEELIKRVKAGGNSMPPPALSDWSRKRVIPSRAMGPSRAASGKQVGAAFT